MKKNFTIPQNCPLFASISEDALSRMLDCLDASRKTYEKNEFIFIAGDSVCHAGIVLSGAVHVLNEDFWGRRVIMTRIVPGGLFGEAFACAGIQNLPISVMAAETSEVLFLDCGKIFTLCSSACAFHAGLLKNLTRILAEKNVILTQKLEHITQRTTREKLLAYLSEQARLAGDSAFEIPFNREELACYLSVERSAMSAELSKMRADGLLRYQKNHFELLRNR